MFIINYTARRTNCKDFSKLLCLNYLIFLNELKDQSSSKDQLQVFLQFPCINYLIFYSNCDWEGPIEGPRILLSSFV